MGKINFGRVLMGGIAGGVVGFILGGLIFSVLFKPAMDASVTSGMMKAPDNATLGLEFISTTVFALVATYVYALARPRLGASVNSALHVSLLMTLFAFVTGMAGMMIWSTTGCGGDMLLPGLVGLAIPFAETFVGAWIYKD